MPSNDHGLSATVGQVFFGNFADLRPVQETSIDSLCGGRNVVLSAGTGSGKTEAVVAPLVSRFRIQAIRQGTSDILYVCPTKALINDLARRLTPPLDRLGLRLAVRHGDRNDLDIATPAHVIVTTPESLGILIATKHPTLATIRAVVLDEVHLLYNNQRGQMVAILLNRLRGIATTPLQFAALSATVGDLKDVKNFILGPKAEADLLPFPGGRTIDGDIRVADSLEAVGDLVARLMKVPSRKLLVFGNSRAEVERITGELKSRPGLGKIVHTHHSSLSPDQRHEVERRFEGEPRGVCVSTSTLEMGIDIGDIDAVLLYGPPFTVESLLQRIGRGNRRSKKTNVICLSRDGDDSVHELVVFSTMLSLAAAGRMPAQSPYELFGAVAQQCLAKVVEEEGAFTRAADLTEAVAYRPDVDRTLIDGVLANLEETGFLQAHGFKNRYGAAERLWDLRDKHLVWGNFPLASQTIDLTLNGRLLGTIPRANLLRLHNGSCFRFGGNRYAVVNLIERDLRVREAPGRGEGVKLIFGKGGPDGLDAFVANGVWHWLFEVNQATSFMLPGTWDRVFALVDDIRSELKPDSLPWCSCAAGMRYFTFGGVTLNRVISAWLGLDSETADEWSIAAPTKLDWSKLPVSTEDLRAAAERCFAPSDRQTIFQQALPLELQRKEWLEGWLKDGDAVAVLCRLQTSKPVEIPTKFFAPLTS